MAYGRGGSSGGGRGRGVSSFQSRQAYDAPPSEYIELGHFMHASENDLVCRSVCPKIPYFNAPIYNEKHQQIGKVDEILGPINEVYFTVKPVEGVKATSFKGKEKVFIGGDKLLPLERFLPKPPAPKVKKPKGTSSRGASTRGASRGFSRGASRGFSRGGRGRGGFSRGGGRGSSGFSRGTSRGFSRGGSSYSK